MQILRHLCLTLLLILNVASQDEYVDEEYETVDVELRLADYDMMDAFDEVSEASKAALLGNGFSTKILVEKDRAVLLKRQAERNRQPELNVPYELERNWTLLTKTGDALVPQDDYNSLVDFHNANEELLLQTKIPCVGSSENCSMGLQGLSDTLSTNRTLKVLNQTWSTWQENLQAHKGNFSNILQLVNKAFLPNDQHSPMSYWEMLSEYTDGYSKAQQLWEEVQPLYKKLNNFVKKRLFNHYNITANDTEIPVYLLGSNFGIDWSNIADIVLPHPYLHDEVLAELHYQTVEEIYGLAESSIKSMGLAPLGRGFWRKSNFSSTLCGPNIFTYCNKQYSEIVTCSKLTWKEYLDIHETAMDVALRNQDFSSLPRRDARFSAFDEALQGLGSLIAIDNLPKYELIPKDAFISEKDEYQRRKAALLLVALRTLPKLPFYLLSDLRRLEELEFSYGNFTERWWEKRMEMQGVEGNTNLETDFLGDSFITSNRPYLSKFLGVFLQFQILDYYQKFFTVENGTLTQFIANDNNFMSMVNDRPNKDWPNLISFHMGFGDVSATPLLEYFGFLEEYLDEAPATQVKIPVKAKQRPVKVTTTLRPKKPKKRLTTLAPTLPPNAVQNDSPTEKKPKAKAAEPPPETQQGTAKIYVLAGIAGVICSGALVVLVVKRLRRRQRTNNRRFET